MGLRPDKIILDANDYTLSELEAALFGKILPKGTGVKVGQRFIVRYFFSSAEKILAVHKFFDAFPRSNYRLLPEQELVEFLPKDPPFAGLDATEGTIRIIGRELIDGPSGTLDDSGDGQDGPNPRKMTLPERIRFNYANICGENASI